MEGSKPNSNYDVLRAHHLNPQNIMRVLASQSTLNEVNLSNSNGNPSSRSQSGSNSSRATNHEVPSSSILELHPNIVLQNLVLGGEESEERPHMCQVCRATYKTRTHLRRHMFIHLSNRPYPCGECGKGFNRKEHLQKHEAIHTGTKYKCHFCGKEISRKDHLSRHIKNMHSSFSNPSSHKIDIHDEESLNSVLKVQLPCGQKQKAQLSFLAPNFPNCDGSPPPTGGLTGSMKGNKHFNNRVSSGSQINSQPNPNGIVSQNMNNGNGPVPLGSQVPSTSKQSFSQNKPQPNPFNLNISSMKSGSGNASSNEKKLFLQLYTCTECTATFTSEKDMTTHHRTHKPQPFKCTECPRAYTRREKLSEHIRCFHQGQKFSCEICGKELSRKDHVLRHVRSVHPEVLANRFVNIGEDGNYSQLKPSTSSPLQGNNGTNSNIPSMGDMGALLRSVCHVCLKVFGTHYHLSRHIESCHNGDLRPYSCAACHKAFKRKDHLSKHLRSHCASHREPMPLKGPPSSQPSSNGVESSLDHLSDQLDAGDLASIHPDAIESLRIEMMSPGSREQNHPVDGNRRTSHDEDIKTEGQSENFGLDSFMDGSGHTQLSIPNPGSTNLQIPSPAALRAASSQPGGNFSCGHCNKEFSSREKLITHLQNHSNTDEQTSTPLWGHS